jgi:hypothetical protein
MATRKNRRNTRRNRKNRRSTRRYHGGSGVPASVCSQKFAAAQIKAVQEGRKSANVKMKNIPGCNYLA